MQFSEFFQPSQAVIHLQVKIHSQLVSGFLDRCTVTEGNLWIWKSKLEIDRPRIGFVCFADLAACVWMCFECVSLSALFNAQSLSALLFTPLCVRQFYSAILLGSLNRSLFALSCIPVSPVLVASLAKESILFFKLQVKV